MNPRPFRWTFWAQNTKQAMRLFFPDIPICVYCGKELREGCLCLDCRKKADALRIGEDLPFSGFSCKCVFNYGDIVRRLIHRYKFGGERWLSRYMGECLCECFAGRDFDIVSYIPLHEKRERTRGFNQVRLLAEMIAEYSDKPCVSLLVRKRNTPPQSSLEREARLQNVRGAFALLPGVSVSGKKVLLIDDVVTVGATMGECVTVLRSAGARVTCAAFSAALL